VNYLPRLALNRDPPGLCLLSSWDYRCEPLEPCSQFPFMETRETLDQQPERAKNFLSNSHPYLLTGPQVTEAVVG
jgi:hypothetical protein